MMFKKREIPLKIELFSSGEDNQFRIRSKREIQSILQGIAKQGARVALYFDEENDFILTTVLGANERGVWLEFGSIAASNQLILRSPKIIFISSHRDVKVQFVSYHIEKSLFENTPAFFLPLPESLLRIQRREYFRLTTPAVNPLKCVIPLTPQDVSDHLPMPTSRREAVVMDISGGGIALVCEVHDTELHVGNLYKDCRITLPDVGAIEATIRIKNAFEITLRNGQVCKRVGCEFVQLDGESSTLLQRYVARLQSNPQVVA